MNHLRTNELLSQEDFGLVQAMLAQRVGITLSGDKQYLVVNRLAPLVRSFQFESLHSLIASLKTGGNSRLWDEVVDVLAVHETFFFRDQAPFQQLQREILPEICREAERTGRKVHIWSAGCSTGQEAYSIAMLLFEIAPHLASQFKILGSDVSPKVLNAAREGLFRPFEVSRGLSQQRLQRFFEPVDQSWRVIAGLREMTEWQNFSLAGPWPSLPSFDLILLRNVMVYFDGKVRESLVQRLHPQLRRGGRLVIGSAESLMAYPHSFRPQTSLGATHYVAE